MDWFLYDWDLRHEKINSITSEIVKIGVFKTRLLVRKIFHRPGLFWQLFSFLFFFFFCGYSFVVSYFLLQPLRITFVQF